MSIGTTNSVKQYTVYSNHFNEVFMYKEFLAVLQQQCVNLNSMVRILMGTKLSKQVKSRLNLLQSVASYLEIIFPVDSSKVSTLPIYKELDTDISVLSSPRVVVLPVPEVDVLLYEDLIRATLDIAEFIRRGLLTLKQLSDNSLPTESWRYLYELTTWVILFLEWLISGRIPEKLSLASPKIVKAIDAYTVAESDTNSEKTERQSEDRLAKTKSKSANKKPKKSSTKRNPVKPTPAKTSTRKRSRRVSSKAA